MFLLVASWPLRLCADLSSAFVVLRVCCFLVFVASSPNSAVDAREPEEIRGGSC